LKGWIPLIKAFVDMKQDIDKYSSSNEYMSHPELFKGNHKSGRHKKIIENSCLVLAGPDPNSIQDDPEGLETLKELKEFYDQLGAKQQQDIMIVELPMEDVAQNALIVNAIQRASYVIVQNSIREGFGLTATEAMYKGVCFVGTHQAIGLRTQVRDGIDGLLIQGDPSDYKNVAMTLNTVLGDVELHDSLAVNGAKRATKNFLIYKQVEEWIKNIPKLIKLK
jgi:trehalose synthase